MVKVSSQSQQAWVRDPATIASIRGGYDSDYEEEDDEEAEVEADWEQDEYDKEEGGDKDAVLTDEHDSALEENVFDEKFVDEDDFVHVEQEESFDDEEEEEEEVVFVDAQEEVFEEVDKDEEVEEEEVFEDALEDVPEEEPEPLAQVLEERMATTTDDENSSAFVDRMELADAYDKGETTAGGDAATELAAVTAATITSGGSDEDQAVVTSAAAAAEEEESQITEITDEMKAILRKLHYKPRDVKVMRPDIAAMVVAKRLRRPIEGMPPNWYVEGSKLANNTLGKNAIKVSLTLMAVGTMALVGLKGEKLGLELDSAQDALKKSPAMLAAAPTAETSTGSKVKKEAASAIPTTSATPTVREAEAPVEESESEEDDHPCSVKPFSDHPPSYEEDLDKSWMDKVITGIENVVKAFFRIKI